MASRGREVALDLAGRRPRRGRLAAGGGGLVPARRPGAGLDRPRCAAISGRPRRLGPLGPRGGLVTGGPAGPRARPCAGSPTPTARCLVHLADGARHEASSRRVGRRLRRGQRHRGELARCSPYDGARRGAEPRADGADGQVASTSYGGTSPVGERRDGPARAGSLAVVLAIASRMCLRTIAARVEVAQLEVGVLRAELLAQLVAGAVGELAQLAQRTGRPGGRARAAGRDRRRRPRRRRSPPAPAARRRTRRQTTSTASGREPELHAGQAAAAAGQRARRPR